MPVRPAIAGCRVSTKVARRGPRQGCTEAVDDLGMELFASRGSDSHAGTNTAECEQRGKGVTSVLLHVSFSMSKRSRSASTCTHVSESR